MPSRSRKTDFEPTSVPLESTGRAIRCGSISLARASCVEPTLEFRSGLECRIDEGLRDESRVGRSRRRCPQELSEGQCRDRGLFESGEQEIQLGRVSQDDVTSKRERTPRLAGRLCVDCNRHAWKNGQLIEKHVPPSIELRASTGREVENEDARTRKGRKLFTRVGCDQETAQLVHREARHRSGGQPDPRKASRTLRRSSFPVSL